MINKKNKTNKDLPLKPLLILAQLVSYQQSVSLNEYLAQENTPISQNDGSPSMRDLPNNQTIQAKCQKTHPQRYSTQMPTFSTNMAPTSKKTAYRAGYLPYNQQFQNKGILKSINILL